MPVRIVQSKQNSRLKELRAALAHPGSGDRGSGDRGLCGIEGPNLIAEALRSGLAIHTVFLAQRSQRLLEGLRIPVEVEILILEQNILTSALATETPQPIAALVQPPIWTWEHVLGLRRNTVPLILVLAGLQDPGNLGTILRSAEAFGATGIVALTRTVSAWNPKAVRASAGSVFRVPLIASTAEDCITRLHRAEVSIWSTAALPEAATEASGHDPGSRTAGESRSGTSVDSDQSRFVSGHDFSRAEKAPKNDGALAPGTPIAAHHANLAGPVALIIGNEGNGVPPELAARADATITIPCPGPVESLNAAVAASILLYEAAQQRASQPSTKQAARKVE